jgi:hypothetical protein
MTTSAVLGGDRRLGPWDATNATQAEMLSVSGGMRHSSRLGAGGSPQTRLVALLGRSCVSDIDVCDRGHAPGTCTPEPGGLTARELLDSVCRIAYELPVVGMARRRDAADGTTWDPSQPLLDRR